MLYVTGGRQRTRKADEWHRFDKALVIGVDVESRKLSTCAEYITPPDRCAHPEPSVLFKAASLVNGRVFACTSTEVVIFDVPDFRQSGYVSLPCFNDLHHAWPTTQGTLLVVNTGLDMLLEMTGEAEVLREWSAMGGDEPWERFSRDIDYRKVATTKPHASHPNYVFRVDDEIWLTRFHQCDAICITRPERRVKFGKKPHDGVERNGWLYFTSIDGFVFVVNQRTMMIEETIDLNAIDQRSIPLGWCRGILPVDETVCWVGFTKIRPTTFKENVRWLQRKIKGRSLATRVALYDLRRKTKLDEINLESCGLHCVFSILRAPDFFKPKSGKQIVAGPGRDDSRI